MLIALLLVALVAPQRTYHRVPLDRIATTARTHVETCGPVVYVRRQRDGDVHVTLDNGRAKVVVEIIPAIPLTAPRKGQRIRVRGITRYDKGHRVAEIHPAEQIAVVAAC